MREESLIFGFELDFAGSLRCIPMVVRFKLDQCGVKLSLKQWSRFIKEERSQLVTRACDTPEDVLAYKNYLVELIETRARDAAVFLPVDTNPEWDDTHQVPSRVAAHAMDNALLPPRTERWAALSPLQRFALFKLTRPGHDNDNFVPAMQEFGFTD